MVRLSPVERLDHAFTVAKDQLAIERLLDPEGTETLSNLNTFLHCTHMGQLYLFVKSFRFFPLQTVQSNMSDTFMFVITEGQNT